jgi:hypothetical protein
MALPSNSTVAPAGVVVMDSEAKSLGLLPSPVAAAELCVRVSFPKTALAQPRRIKTFSRASNPRPGFQRFDSGFPDLCPALC